MVTKAEQIADLLHQAEEIQEKGQDFIEQIREFIFALRTVDRDLADGVRRGWFASIEMALTTDHEWLARRDSIEDTLAELTEMKADVEWEEEESE